MSKRLVIIDGKSVFYRGYYAMRGLTTSTGLPSSGIYGFTLLALNIIKKLNPQYVCVAWDKSKTNTRLRKKMYAEYKANRQSAPDDFYEQLPPFFKLLEAFNWPLYELDDYEADDIMAALAQQARQVDDLETILVSSDLDMLQALGENTKIFLLKNGLKNIYELDVAEFEQKYGIKVEQFRDLKALMGDSSDNVPGVTGIGKKRATQLLIEHQSLENVYKNIDEIPESTRKKLIECKEMAFLSQKLVTLMTDAPIKLDLKAMSINDLDTLALQNNLRELEFYSLLQQIPKGMQTADHPDLIYDSEVDLKKPKVSPVEDLKKLNELNWKKPVFLHAYCRHRFGRDLVYLLASDDQKTVHVYQASSKPPKLAVQEASIYGFDCKQLVQILNDLNVKNIKVVHDLNVAAFLLNSLRRLQTLTSLADSQLGYVGELNDLPADDFLLKAAEIAAVVFKLKKLQEAEIHKLPKLKKLAEDIEWPFIPVIARLERAGIALDIKALEGLKVYFQKEMDLLQKTIYDFAGEEFNLSSPAQLSEILYTKLKLPTMGLKKTQRGYSTDAESLEKLRKDFPIVIHVLKWRELAKLQGTYVEGLLEHVEDNGRVYSEMRLTSVATGRLSSANPNLQNIPIKTEIGARVRQVFIAQPGYQLISADYSQFELRLAAVLAGDKDLIKAFNQGIDIHSLAASVVFGVPLKKVSKEQRYMAKTINFGVLYGQGPHSLAALTGMSYIEAKGFIAKYFENRPRLKRYLERTKADAQKNGYVETLFGRRRFLPDINSHNYQLREASLRQAINMPIQGTEADLMKMAMIKLESVLDYDCRQVMQVHDSVLIECPLEKVSKTSALVLQEMENVYPSLGVQLKIDIAVDNRWPIT